jgi:hypothetical protein
VLCLNASSAFCVGTHGALQIAAREMEIVRISTALRRADELDYDVAAAIEASADGPSKANESRTSVSLNH